MPAATAGGLTSLAVSAAAWRTAGGWIWSPAFAGGGFVAGLLLDVTNHEIAMPTAAMLLATAQIRPFGRIFAPLPRSCAYAERVVVRAAREWRCSVGRLAECEAAAPTLDDLMSRSAEAISSPDE